MFGRAVGGSDPTKGDQSYADKGYTGLIFEVDAVWCSVVWWGVVW